MTNDGQASKITLSDFLKIGQNPTTLGMPEGFRLVSYFPFCILSFAMNRTMENMGKPLIVMEFKTVWWH